MSVTISLLEHTFRLASLFLFPAVAVWAWRGSGPARLWLATGIGLCLIVLLAAFAASATGGNAAFPVLLGRRIKFPLIVGNVGRQLGPLALKGLSLVRGQWHVGDDSAGGKSYAGNGRPCSSGRISGTMRGA